MNAYRISMFKLIKVSRSKLNLINIKINSDFFIINTRYNSNITIYDATRICWRLSKKRADQAQYILSEYHGVVRAVFQMDEKKWQPIAVPGKKAIRYFFTGHEVTDPNVLNLYINKKIVKRHGDSNPIHYRNIK